MTWLTEPEAAEYLKVPEKALRHWRYKHKIDYYKPCGIVQYRKQDLDALRTQCKWDVNRKATNSSNETESGKSAGRKNARLSEEQQGIQIAQKLRESLQRSS